MQNRSENINEIAAALSKAQGIMRGASKDSENPYYNSKYADLGAVWEACRHALSINGLSVVQPLEYDENGELKLVTYLCHLSGQWFRSEIKVKFNENATEITKYGKEIKVNPLQKMGSCLTYLRRYALSSMVGVAPEDDDGNSMEGDTFTENKQLAESKKAVKQEQKKTPPVVKEYTKISAVQVAELKSIISSEYEADLLDYFSKKVGAKSLEDIPAVNFDAILKAAKARLEKQLTEQGESIEQEIAQ